MMKLRFNRRYKMLTLVVLAVICFLLQIERVSQVVTHEYMLPSGTTGPVESRRPSCRDSRVDGLLSLSMSALWTEKTRFRPHSTILQIGTTEETGIRLDLGMGLEDPTTLSYFLVVGTSETSSGYLWYEFPLKESNYGVTNIALSIERRSYELLISNKDGSSERSLGTSPFFGCRFYIGEGREGYEPGFSSGALYSSEVITSEIRIKEGVPQDQSVVGLPKTWVEGFRGAMYLLFAFIAASFIVILSRRLQINCRKQFQLIVNPLGRSVNSAYFRGTLSAEASSLLVVFIILYSIAFAFLYIRGELLEQDWPKNSFFPHPTTRGGDFFLGFSEWAIHGGLGTKSLGLIYPPAAFLWFDFLEMFTRNPYKAIALFRGAYVVVLLCAISIVLKHRGLLTTTSVSLIALLSYPSVFAFFTGNPEMIISAGLVVALTAAERSRWNRFGIVIGLLGGFKIVPLIFLLVPLFFLKSKHALRVISAGLAAAVLINVVALWILPGGFGTNGFVGVRRAVMAVIGGMKMYNEMMVEGAPGIHFGHSVLNAVHAIWGLDALPSETWGFRWFVIAMTIGLVSLYRLKKSSAPLWYYFTLVGALGCVATPTSTDYKLAYMLPGVLAFVARGARGRGELTLVTLVISTLVPKPWLYIGSNPFNSATLWLTSITLPLIIVLLPAAAGRFNSKTKSTEPGTSGVS